jgi:acetyltransferase-like isoleucine patch superfamily enzyme
MKALLKRAAFGAATIGVVPSLISFFLRSQVIGRDRAIEGSTQALGLVPGLTGQYLRRAFLSRTLASCHWTATVEFGTLFSSAAARLDEYVYVGPRCHLGLVHLERDVLIGAGVHIPSGAATHGTDESSRPIREQVRPKSLVTVGAGAWIGSGAIVMADVGHDSVVGAGSVVTRPVPPLVMAVGVPARVVRERGPADGRPDA